MDFITTDTKKTTSISLDELIPYISKIELKNNIPLSKEILIHLKKILTWSQWDDISNKTYSKEIILSNSLFPYLKWSRLMCRHHLNPDLVQKIINRSKSSPGIMQVCLEYCHIGQEYFDQLDDELKWKYFYNQNFKMSDLKTFINKVTLNLGNKNTQIKLISLCSHPDFKPNLTSDLQLLPLLDWGNHLTTTQYTSDEILFKILPLVSLNNLRNFITSNCWLIQKDLSLNLVQKIAGLASFANEKERFKDQICHNPFQDLKKNKLIEDRIKKGDFSLVQICKYRQLPLWFIDRYFFYLQLDELFCYHHQQLSEHFLVRQIQKYFQLDLSIQGQYPNFLAYLVRYYSFDLLFLRALSELVIKTRTLPLPVTTSYWKTLSGYQKLDFKFIKDYINFLDPMIVQTSQKITLEFLEWFLKNKGRLDQYALVKNETFFDLDHEVQEKYITKAILEKSLFSYNYGRKEEIEIVYQANAFSISNSPVSYLQHYQLIQNFVPAEERLDWKQLEIGKTYHSTYTTSTQPLGFNLPQSKTNTPTLKILKELEFIYRANPVLCQYPTFLRISYPLDQSHEAYSVNYNSLPNISVPKWGYNGGIFTRSFKVLDVKYIDDFEPFRASY